MANTDKRNRLDDEPFSYREAKDGRIMLNWHDQHIKTIAGVEAQKFLLKIGGQTGREAQLIMAKATGNFKHGNERNRSPR